ncbi:Dynamin family protein [Penicillium ucsense]|uniref:Dynamin family protein n=1 Tax=Penicillium ucsense TaxID=2839758 RepID=A0A8J8WK64_9EURO|nr:Dynamin family protein [Penicillium ucsense]KAF7736466.1 Dynamin family protein [Penicillium ucsense]
MADTADTEMAESPSPDGGVSSQPRSLSPMFVPKEEKKGDTKTHSAFSEPDPPAGHEPVDLKGKLTSDPKIDIEQLPAKMAGVLDELNRLADIMGVSELDKNPKTELHRLRQMVRKLGSFSYPETRTVGLIGNTGVGKSTVVNSILAAGNLARSNDGATACTCVIVEYRALDEQHSQNYTIEVEYMSSDEMQELLRKHLESVRQYHFQLERPMKVEREKPDDDNGTEIIESGHDDNEDKIHERADDEDELTPEERAYLKKANHSAHQTFDSLFKGGQKPTDKFLLQEDQPDTRDGPNTQSKIIAELLKEVKRGLIHRPGGPDAVRYKEAAENFQTFTALLDRLTSDNLGELPAIWPFIRLIRAYVDAPILKTGLVLADMPGMHDLNYTRQKASENYIRSQCHVLAYVTRMTRCQADETIEEMQWRVITNMQPILIVTRSEEISGAGGDRGDASQNLVTQDWDEKLKQIKKKRKTLNSLANKAKEAEKDAIYAELGQLGEEEDDLVYQKERFLISKRNQRTEVEMSIMPSRRGMKVFCVSNKLYADNCAADDERSQAYIKLSGIPELQEHCRSILSDAQKKQAAQFLRIDFPAAVASTKLWVFGANDTTSKKKAAVIKDELTLMQRKLKQTFQDEHRGLVQRSRMELERMFQRRILTAIDTESEAWQEHCELSCSYWVRNWSHGSFTAACRKKGKHKSAAYGEHDWNAELFEPGNEPLTTAWNAFHEAFHQEMERVLKEVDDLMLASSKSLRGSRTFPDQIREAILKNVDLTRDKVWACFNKALNAVNDAYKNIQSDMIDVGANRPTCFIAEFMLPAYQYANGQGGSGSDKRRKKAIDDQVTSGGPGQDGLVRSYHAMASQAFTQMLDHVYEILGERVNEAIDPTLQVLQTVIDAQGKAPEASTDMMTAVKVSEQLNSITESLHSATAVLLQLEQQ